MWIESGKAATLNRRVRKKQFLRFKYTIRAVEMLYLFALLIITIRLQRTTGQSYSVITSVFVFLLSVLTILLYIWGRNGLKSVLNLNAEKLTLDPHSNSYWAVIRNVSTVVIAANIGICGVQLFLMIRVKNFQELVQANNDTVNFYLIYYFRLCWRCSYSSIFVCSLAKQPYLHI